MKCPFCEYEDGWNAEKQDTVKGAKGHFYNSPVKMEQVEFYEGRTAVLQGCPQCGKVFIEV